MYYEPLINSVYPVDLHLHSYYSDGTETPSEIVHKASQLGIQVLALTDHDCVLGIDEAREAAAAYSMTVISALEFSIGEETKHGYPDLHILAYGIRHHDHVLQPVLKRIHEIRLQQKICQVEKLQTHGLHVPIDDVLALAHGVPTLMHIAQVALMHNRRSFSSIQDVFDQYLVVNATYSTYVPRTFEIYAEETIELIHEVGGVAVLAHPGLYADVVRMDNVIYRLAQAGLDGLEVRYTYAKNRGFYQASNYIEGKLIEHFDALADELDLLKTAGSDYHGTAKPTIVLGEAGLTSLEWQVFQAVTSQKNSFCELGYVYDLKNKEQSF